jgi:gamma-glutamyl hercynylcysteine S-oxide synthase
MLITGMTQTLSERYHDVRRRTRQIFDLIAPEAFDMRPIPLRHPLRFYEGHLASFNFGMLLQSGFVENDPQPDLTTLFARGIDPLDTSAADKLTIQRWPERAVVADYITRVEKEMERAFESEIDPIYPHTAVEHEEMHQETLMYLIHRVPYELKRKPGNVQSELRQSLSSASWIRIEAGSAQLGADPKTVPFGWDNEFPQMRADVAAFEIASRKVSNGDFLEFIDAGGYQNEKLWTDAGWKFIKENKLDAPPFWSRKDGEWRYDGLFESMPLPLDWPVYVSHIEALAFTRWRGCRLPSEAEWHRAFEGAPAPRAQRDNFDFVAWNPTPVSDRNGELFQLAGNGWEWTSAPFKGFPGFKPFAHYPGYSADFFDGLHFVLKGASPVTPAELVRTSFRNWFQDHYRYAYTAFRCARDL